MMITTGAQSQIQMQLEYKDGPPQSRLAYEYIEKNYTVSAGNYFRKDADGGKGDDVSSIYSTEVTTQDYDDMRSNYPDFNTMMVNGIQNYIHNQM